ncbi:MAG: TonB-dependent receptor, partial [Blastocatellia bacterium]
TKRYGFQFGGPIVQNKSGFLLDFEARDIHEPTVVDALTLDTSAHTVPFAASVSAPKLLLIGSARVDWQLTPTNVLALRYDFDRGRLDNLGVGGFSLPENGFDNLTSTNGIRISDIAAFGSRISNEARLGITLERTKQQPASSATEILVPGAFISGGAASQSLDHREWHFEFDDYLSLTAGKHSLKLGTQLLDRDIHDSSSAGFNGAFVFGGGLAPELDSAGHVVSGPGGPTLISISGLEQYRRTLLGLPGGVPTKFSLTGGDPFASVNQLYATLFVQDQWRFRPDMLVSLGMRYEAQNEPSFSAGFAPRLGLAYSPDKAQKWVLRARAGMFYNRVDQTLDLQAERLNGTTQQQILVNSPAFPDPFAAGSTNEVIPTLRRLASDIRAPRSLQLQVGFERQLPHGWKIAMNENWARGWASLLSRNINAPLIGLGLNPSSAARPLGVAENLLEFESAGSLKGDVI